VKCSLDVRFFPGDNLKPTLAISSSHNAYNYASEMNIISSPLMRTGSSLGLGGQSPLI